MAKSYEYVRKIQLKRAAAGICIFCASPLFTSQRCVMHYQEMLTHKNNARRAEGKKVRGSSCGRCGAIGHNRRLCERYQALVK